MNNIVFAGRCGISEQADKNLRIIIPETQGEIISGDEKIIFPADGVIVVPAHCVLKLSFRGNEALQVLIEQALTPYKKITVIPDDENGGILFAAKQAEFYFSRTQAKKDAVLSALSVLLISYISASADVAEYSPVTRIIREDIKKNISDSSYSLELAIKKLPLNYDYIRKLFKKETGHTPHGYLLRLRMELAAQIISSGVTNRYSEFTVAQIAEACGYAEPLYFSRVFKKYYGVAPSEYGKNK